MRVLLTTDTVGGVWTFTRELTAGLLRGGHAVALVSFGRLPDASQQTWVDAARSMGEFVYAAFDAPLEWMEGNAAAMAGAASLERVAADFLPDLLHSNQFCFGALAGFNARLVTAHSDVLSWAAACRPGGLEDSEWLRTYRRVVQDGLDGADAVTAPTGWMMEALENNFRLPPVREVIRNGRDIAAPKAAARAMQAVSAGRLWDEAKGLRLLENLELPFPIVVAGEAGGAQLCSSLQHAGRLDEQDLLALFGRSTVYVAASLYEPFGLAPLEAALCGCAIVANDLPSLREVWGDGALYFSGKAGLRALLLRLHEHAGDLLRAQGRSLARAQTLTAARMTGGYVALYEQLLAPEAAACEAGLVYAH